MTDDAVMTAPMRLEIRRILNGPIDRVWEYLTDGNLRQNWFCGGSTATEPGGAIVLSFDHRRLSNEAPPAGHGDDPSMEMNATVLVYDKPSCLKFTWDEGSDGVSTVTILLKNLGDKTELHLVHQDLKPRIQTGVQAGWHAHLDLLVDLLNDVSARDFWVHYRRLEADYEAAQATAD